MSGLGVCTIWATSAGVSSQRPEAAGLLSGGQITVAQLDAALETASDLLYSLSGKQFPGACDAVVRPAARPANLDFRAWTEYLTILGSYGGYSSSWGTCLNRTYGDHERCDWSRQIDLVTYPIQSITAVKVDGVLLDPSAYRLDDNRLLMRVDGNAWPVCQDLTQNDTQPGTFSVSFKWGQNPPTAGVDAAMSFALELAKSRANLPNRLPTRVTSITRQQVQMAILDPMQFLQKQGMPLTGIWDIDLFLRTYNPAGQVSRPLVWSPDRRRMRHPGS